MIVTTMGVQPSYLLMELQLSKRTSDKRRSNVLPGTSES